MNITIASGGVLETSFLPFQLNVLQRVFADYNFKVCISPKAEEFVSRISLKGITKNEVYTEDSKFQNNSSSPNHLFFSNSDLLIVYPASPRIIVEAAIGNITCPVTRVIAFTDKSKILFAPTIHPQLNQKIYQSHIENLKKIGCSFLSHELYPDNNYLYDIIDYLNSNYKSKNKKTTQELIKKIKKL